MTGDFSDDELLTYLDEMLPVDRAAELERALRASDPLRQRLAALIRRRDQGGHTVGEIWRRQRLSCPSRSELGSYVLGALDDGLAGYIEFHLRVVGCRVCQANLDDLRRTQEEAGASYSRRQKFFESSAGRLRSNEWKPDA